MHFLHELQIYLAGTPDLLLLFFPTHLFGNDFFDHLFVAIVEVYGDVIPEGRGKNVLRVLVDLSESHHGLNYFCLVLHIVNCNC